MNGLRSLFTAKRVMTVGLFIPWTITLAITTRYPPSIIDQPKRFWWLMLVPVFMFLDWLKSRWILNTWRRAIGDPSLLQKNIPPTDEQHKQLQAWAKLHPWRSLFTLTLITSSFSIAKEELLFRAPLLVLFASLDDHALLAIVLFGFLFGFLHYAYTDSLTPHIRDRKTKAVFHSKRVLIIWGHVIFGTGVGIWTGYVTVKSQTLWWALLIHFCVNFPLFRVVLVTLLGIIWVLLMALIRRFFPRRSAIDID